MAPNKKDTQIDGEMKPIFALKAAKRLPLPRHSIAIKQETLAVMDRYVTWASGALDLSYDEAQAQFLEVAIPQLIRKDAAFKAHLKAKNEAC